MMKNSTIILALLLLVTFMPTSYSFNNQNYDDDSFDNLSNEGYIAYVINSSESENNNEPVNKECECKGTGVIIHGDGHRTPCPYVNPDTGKCEFGKATDADSVKKKLMTTPFPKLTQEQINKIMTIKN